MAPLARWLTKNRFGLALIALTWLTFFSRTLFGGQVYFLDDLKIIYYPLEYVYAQAQTNWQLPVWSNVFGFGQPLIAWGQLGFFTPLHIVLRLLRLPPLILLQVSTLAYYLAGALGMFIFLRQAKLSQWAAALGGILFAFSGFHIGHLNHVNFYTGTMLLPWLLITIRHFINRPTLPRTGTLSLLTGAIALSSQPQVTLYTLLIAALYGFIYVAISKRLSNIRYSLWLISLTVLAAVLFLGIASFSILPLNEFIPLTERDDGVDPGGLYEFSYPPWHAITLIAPYFYGGHDNYFGAKGFQELAAFTGIIPLLLAGGALVYWQRFRPEKIFAILLIVIAVAFALGRYSPLYTWLVENHILRSLAVPGRFVYFFDTGLAVLAAVGIDELVKSRKSSRIRQAALFTASLAVPAIILAPFIWRLTATVTADLERWRELIQWPLATWWPPIAGLAAYMASALFRKQKWGAPILAAVAAATLVIYGWQYNPLTRYTEAFAHHEIADTLRNYADRQQYPRLYSRPSIFTSTQDQVIHPTESISPIFTIYQPLEPLSSGCLSLPLSAKEPKSDTITAGLHTAPASPALAEVTINTADITADDETLICFPDIDQLSSDSLYVSLSSQIDSGVHAYVSSTPLSLERTAYIVRIPNPSAEDIAASLKPRKLVFTTQEAPTDEVPILERHVNVTAHTSSAHWIAALAIRPYREFIETFFANDSEEVFDGDRVHVLDRNRRLFNMLGVTHLAQYVEHDAEDLLPTLDFPLDQEIKINEKLTARLYRNPSAMPKAFLVPHAVFKPAADHVRYAVSQPDFDPLSLVYVSGEKPPPLDILVEDLPAAAFAGSRSSGRATITSYQDTRVEVEVETDEPTWLVVSDTTTPQWHTFIDNEPTPYYTAHSFMKTAYVPAGTHVVSFRYSSPAIFQAKIATLSALAVIVALLFSQQLGVIVRRLFAALK